MRNFRFSAALIASVVLAALGTACAPASGPAPGRAPSATARGPATPARPAATSAPAAAWHQVTGRLSGAPYQIDLPVRWNHTLIVWSHGYEPSPPGPRVDEIEPVTRRWLLANGYAIAGSGFSSTGWAVADAYRDQAALLGLFTRRYGKPRVTIAVGESMGGLISAGLVERFPGRFSGALPMCAPLGGGTGLWNQALDASFVLKTLLAPGSKRALVHLNNPGGNGALVQQIITRALRTPAGRARLALAAAMVGKAPGPGPRLKDSSAPCRPRAKPGLRWAGAGAIPRREGRRERAQQSGSLWRPPCGRPSASALSRLRPSQPSRIPRAEGAQDVSGGWLP